jgi:hypothetical protein
MQPINLYTSTQACPKVLNLALDLHLLGRQVILRPLSELPAPTTNRSKRLQLEQEQRDVQAMLSTVHHLLEVAKAAPHKYGYQLTQLHLDAAKYQGLLTVIAQQLRQEGGQANG